MVDIVGGGHTHQDGVIHALAFWWNLQLCEDVQVCTLSGYQQQDRPEDQERLVGASRGSTPVDAGAGAGADTSHWRQAAVVVPGGGVEVSAGDVISVMAAVEGSSVLLQVLAIEKAPI